MIDLLDILVAILVAAALTGGHLVWAGRERAAHRAALANLVGDLRTELVGHGHDLRYAAHNHRHADLEALLMQASSALDMYRRPHDHPHEHDDRYLSVSATHSHAYASDDHTHAAPETPANLSGKPHKHLWELASREEKGGQSITIYRCLHDSTHFERRVGEIG